MTTLLVEIVSFDYIVYHAYQVKYYKENSRNLF
jgi:hypothetical protein